MLAAGIFLVPPFSFADFEDVARGDWTVEGAAFDTSPATDALFPGKIRGFGGNGFVCTPHPKKGNAATGKAVCREFTIEKPFITFKIGGGSFPGQACLNLVVDGQVVRAATGNVTASLSDASWDVSALVRKKARFEIVDDTVSTERGYIMAGDVTFATKLSATYIRDGFMPPIKVIVFSALAVFTCPIEVGELLPLGERGKIHSGKAGLEATNALKTITLLTNSVTCKRLKGDGK